MLQPVWPVRYRVSDRHTCCISLSSWPWPLPLQQTAASVSWDSNLNKICLATMQRFWRPFAWFVKGLYLRRRYHGHINQYISFFKQLWYSLRSLLSSWDVSLLLCVAKASGHIIQPSQTTHQANTQNKHMLPTCRDACSGLSTLNRLCKPYSRDITNCLLVNMYVHVRVIEASWF